jgi:hypothetical protein
MIYHLRGSPKEKTAAALAGNTTASQNTQHHDSSVAALLALGEKLTAFNRMKAAASKCGIDAYPLSGDSVYLSGPGGFHCCAPDVRTAAILVRRMGGRHG